MNKKEKTQIMLVIGAILIIFSAFLIQLNFQQVVSTNADLQGSKTIGWGIKRENKHSGFHSLRHSTASMLLEMETPLPVITNILGHTDPDKTAIYLKTDLMKLAECVLQPPGEEI